VTPRRWLWLILRPHRSRSLLAGGLAVAGCFFALANPFLVQRILVTAGQSQNAAALTVLCTSLLAVTLLHAIASTANTWLLGKLALNVVRDLRLHLYERLQQMPLAWFDRTSTGAIISRLMDDVVSIQSIASGQTLVTLIDLCIALGAGIWLCTRSWKIAAVVFTLVPLYAMVFHFFTRRIRSGTFEVGQQLDQLFGSLKQKIDGIQIVRATAAEPTELSEFTQQITALHEPRLRVNGLAISFSNLCVGLGGIGVSLVFAVGASHVLTGRLAVGELIAACALAGMLFAPIARFSDLAAQYQQSFASLTRLGEILSTIPSR
jgi:ATP-binding cassette subfamily B protein